jgi:hypothetical protein
MKTKRNTQRDQQLARLTPEQRLAVERVTCHLIAVPGELDGGMLVQTMAILNPSGPAQGDDLLESLRNRFASVYGPAAELAETELQRLGLRSPNCFRLRLLIDPCQQGITHLTVIDHLKPVCYLHEQRNASEFGFATLAALANEVLRIKQRLIQGVLAAQPVSAVVYVTVEDGAVQVCNLAPGIEVYVFDYDLKDAVTEMVQTSPLDARPCVIQKFSGDRARPIPRQPIQTGAKSTGFGGPG